MSTERGHRIVVALDLSEYSPIVFEHALDQAAQYDEVELHVLTVRGGRGRPALSEDEAKSRLHWLVVDGLAIVPVGRSGRWRVRLHLRFGRPAEEIAGLAGEIDADLIVVGRFGVSGVRKRLRASSVADQLLPLAPCPTLVVNLSERPPVSLQCEECVAVRRQSDGESWFCPAHRGAPGTLGASVLLPHQDWGLGGGLMW